MRRVHGSIFVLLLGLLGAAQSAGAQSIPSNYRFVENSQAVGIWGGYVATARGTVGLGPESAAIGGVRYAIRLSGPVDAEGDIGYFKTKRSVLDTMFTSDGRLSLGTADLNLLTANATLRFNLTGPRTWRGLQPYFAFGAGAVIDLSGRSGLDEDLPADIRFDFGTSFAGQVGAGIEWFTSDRLSIRLDGRNVLWRVTAPFPFLLSDPTDETPEQEWLQNVFFTAGISIRF